MPLWPMVVAGIIGGIIMLKIGINRALWLFGVAQIVTILGFAWLVQQGPFEQVDNFVLLSLTLVVTQSILVSG